MSSRTESPEGRAEEQLVATVRQRLPRAARRRIRLRSLSPLLAVFLSVHLSTPAPAGDRSDLLSIYRQLIETDTTHSTGSTGRAAEAMAARLRDAGYPDEDVHVVGPKPDRMNLVARLHGNGSRQPLLLLAHLDVVEAKREDWSVDPFTLLEQGGYYYGRGSIDDKAMAAIFVEIMIQQRANAARQKPDRDIVLALTADEESGPDDGVAWLLENRRDLIKAGLALNEGGGGRIRDGEYVFNGIQASEKSYMTFVLEARDKGGHSSLPGKNNPIYRIAAALEKLEGYQFPVELNDVTRNFFARMAEIERGETAHDMKELLRTPPDAEAAARLSETPAYNAALRTTCVATRLEGGHADNALPQSAKATVNCRILPGHSLEETRATLTEVVGDDQVAITPVEPDTSAPSSELDAGFVQTVEMVTGEMWPGVPVVATMSSGSTDSRYLRRAGVPAYGVSGIFMDMNDIRAHGKDERVGVKQFYDGYAFLSRLVDVLAH